MDVTLIESAQLWNADAYWQSGHCPWTVFAYPASLADDRRLPRDSESARYLAALIAAGAKIGVWYFPANETVYFACPFEERDRIQSIVNEFERRGTFPKNFARDHCEDLFHLST
jgi:hypothetical protein